MDGRPTWTDCHEAGDYVVPNVLSPRDIVSRPDKWTKLYHTQEQISWVFCENKEIILLIAL